MKKVCIMTSVHPHNDVRIYHRQAVCLALRGYRVIILNSFFSGRDKNGIRFLRVKAPASRFGRIIVSPLSFYCTAVKTGADIYHIHDPELIPAGLLLKAMGQKVIYDAHEDLPLQVLDKHWIPVFCRQAVSCIAEFTLNKASRIFDSCIAATDEISLKLHGAATIHNFPDSSEIKKSNVPFNQRKFDAVYIGSITQTRGIETMLEAARLGGHSFALAGSFENSQLMTFCKQHPGWKNTEYKGVLGRKKVSALLKDCRCGLILLKPTRAYLKAFPIKMFEYMMSGIPIIASDFPLWRKLSGEDCAIFVNPQDPGQVAAAIQWLKQNPEIAEKMGVKSRKRAEENFDFKNEGKKLLDLYANL